MNKLTEVLQAIRDANPEIMEVIKGEWVRSAGRRASDEAIRHPLHIGHLLKALEKFAFDEAPLLTCECQLADYNPETGSLHLTGVFVNPTQDLETQLKENPELVDTLHTLIVK